MIEHQPGRFEENLNFWKQKNVNAFHPPSLGAWEFCRTGKKELLNLRQPLTDRYLYSPRNIESEMRQWSHLFNTAQTECIVVYGVGLGYYYLSLKNWLLENDRRLLIFIEDDVGVLRAFFETDCASDFLQNPQVSLIFCPENDHSLTEVEGKINKILFRKMHISALASYEEYKRPRFEEIRFLINIIREIKEAPVAEYLLKGKVFFENFYNNILNLDSCLDGTLLRDAFQGIPAIICGAGPSIGKNIEVLKQLKDRALIFAGGTAMNALNAYNLIPHFGCGVDPFSTQYSRMISNKAFDTPFFIRSRMNKDTVAAITGPKIYLPGASGYSVAEWVDKQLNYTPLEVNEGANVINMSLSIAQFLGCNPILCVGVDLAYTNGLSYAPGITAHGVHDPKEEFVTKGTAEELILVNDINGQPVYSLMKWVLEAIWYSSIAAAFPNLQLYNCTEGGIGFQNVENLALAEAAERYLKIEHDIDGKIDQVLSNISNQRIPSVSEEKKVIETLVGLLEQSANELLKIKHTAPAIWPQQVPSESSELKEIEKLLTSQEAYDFFLKAFDESYCQYMGSHSQNEKHPYMVQGLLKGRFPYLLEIIVDNIKYIEKALREKVLQEKSLNQITEQVSIECPIKDSSFLKNSHFQIKNDALGIQLEGKVEEYPFNSDTLSGHKQVFDEGKLVYSGFYKQAILHGPSIYYFSNGKPCSKSWYYEGKKEGVKETYDPEGQLLSQACYKDGLEEGCQLVFYSNGKLKSSINYSKGLLNGPTSLYFPNGALRRQLSFKMGKKEGQDDLYDTSGCMRLQAEYREDKPIGVARIWYENGMPAKEVVYKAPGIIDQIKKWDFDGNIISDSASSNDYFDQVAKDSLSLGNLISHMSESVNAIASSFTNTMEEDQKTSVADDLKQLAKEMESFKEIQEQLMQTSGLDGSLDREAIWKTPSNAQWMKDYLQETSSPMQESLLQMRWKLQQLRKKLNRDTLDDSGKR